MTPKERQFVEAYVGPARGNATEAARIAGYQGSAQTLRVVGHKNLRKPNVAAAVGKRTEKGLKRLGIDDILAGIEEIALDSRRPTRDRIRAYELLGKHLNMWTDLVAAGNIPTTEAELREFVRKRLV